MRVRVRFRYRIINEPGIIPHIYASEKDNPAMFAADGRGLQAVTLSWLFAHKEAHQGAFYFMRRNGFNNFIRVVSVDANPIAPSYPVQLEGWPERELAPHTMMFVLRRYVEEEIE